MVAGFRATIDIAACRPHVGRKGPWKGVPVEKCQNGSPCLKWRRTGALEQRTVLTLSPVSRKIRTPLPSQREIEARARFCASCANHGQGACVIASGGLGALNVPRVASVVIHLDRVLSSPGVCRATWPLITSLRRARLIIRYLNSESLHEQSSARMSGETAMKTQGTAIAYGHGPP